MKVPKSVLEQIVKEEIAAHVRSLLEAPKGIDVVDADDEKKGKEKEGGKGEEKPLKPSAGPKAPKQASDKPAEKPAEKGKGPKELPVGKEPDEPEEVPDEKVPGEGEKGEDDGVEDADEVTGGKIADSVQGKTVQSITMEPESKILPGAQEVTLTFREMPDPLKILITKSGQVKFHFRGLHNTLGEAAPAMSSQQAAAGGQPPSAAAPIVKKTNHPNNFSMSNDEYLTWVKNPPANIKVVSAKDGKPIADMDQNQVRWSLSKAAFMKGMAKGTSGEAEYWIAPIVRKK